MAALTASHLHKSCRSLVSVCGWLLCKPLVLDRDLCAGQAALALPCNTAGLSSIIYPRTLNDSKKSQDYFHTSWQVAKTQSWVDSERACVTLAAAWRGSCWTWFNTQLSSSVLPEQSYNPIIITRERWEKLWAGNSPHQQRYPSPPPQQNSLLRISRESATNEAKYWN